MKKLIFAVILLLISTSSTAGTWCHWTGAVGQLCKDDSKGYIVISGRPISTPAVANAHGYYKVTITSDTPGAETVWVLDGTGLLKTPSITEIDEDKSKPMAVGQYYLWKALIAKGLITQAEAVNFLPAELIDAYQARERLLQ